MDRAARDLLSRHTSNRACFAQRERDKPRLSLKNNTAGVREREDANRTREAGNRDEVEGVVANRLNLFRQGAVGFIERLRLISFSQLRSLYCRVAMRQDLGPNRWV
jgi:hypothetical protein